MGNIDVPSSNANQVLKIPMSTYTFGANLVSSKVCFEAAWLHVLISSFQPFYDCGVLCSGYRGFIYLELQAQRGNFDLSAGEYADWSDIDRWPVARESQVRLWLFKAFQINFGFLAVKIYE